MAQKNVESVITPGAPHFVGDGFRVHNFIPKGKGLSMHRMDPFILMDYNSKFYFEPTDQPRGVSVHPHKGFETVTIAYRGKVAHHDSSGSGGVIAPGDVQWMTAGAGILHKEYHEENFSKQGGDFQMVQLWVNLPAKDKNTTPKYQGIQSNNINKVNLPENQGTIEVIAGSYKNNHGPANTFTPMHVYNARLHQGAEADFEFPPHYNTALLVVEGAITINGKEKVATDHMALFGQEGETFEITAEEQAVVLLLSGDPIGEPIAAHGPFVMNTREELMDAFQDFNQGKFGYME